MGGTTNKASAASAADDKGAAALTAMTGERDAALAQAAANTAELETCAAKLQAIGAAIIAAGLEPEGDWSTAERAIELIGFFTAQNAGLAHLGKVIDDLGLAPDGGYAFVLDFAAEKLAEIPALVAERDQAVADLATATKAVEKGKADLKAARSRAAPKPAKLRAIGPLDDGEPLSGEALQRAIAAADTVELVFSDGARELAGVPAQLIEGDAWHLAANGVRMRVPSLVVHGPAHGEAPYRLAGYGLLLDGEQVAWAARIDVLQIQASSRHELKDDVVFG